MNPQIETLTQLYSDLVAMEGSTPEQTEEIASLAEKLSSFINEYNRLSGTGVITSVVPTVEPVLFGGMDDVDVMLVDELEDTMSEATNGLTKDDVLNALVDELGAVLESPEEFDALSKFEEHIKAQAESFFSWEDLNQVADKVGLPVAHIEWAKEILDV